MRKKIIISLSVLLCSAALVGSVVAIKSNNDFSQNAKAAEEIRSITIDTTTNVLTDSKEFVESTATLKTDQLKNDVGFKFKAKLNDDGASFNLSAGNLERAYVMNMASSPIGNIKTIEVNKMSGDYNSYLIEYGWDLDGEGNVIYENGVYNNLTTDLGPSYFRIGLEYDYDYESKIESIVITYSVNCEQRATNPYMPKDGIRYLVYSDHAEVAGLDDYTLTNITISSLISGKPVTAIGKYAFSGTNIVNVVLNASISKISDHAFYRCSSLESVIGCANIKTIDDQAFYECRKMTTIPFEGNVIESIGVKAFQSCSLMQSTLNFGEQITFIGNSAFRYCNKITSLVFDDNCELKQFSKGFESDMGGLTTVHIGENMTDPDGMNQAWYSDKALETFTIGTSGTENAKYKVIDNAVYKKLQNDKLELLFILQGGGNSYVAPSNVTELNNYFSYDNQTITTVDLRNLETTVIPYCSFQGSANLLTVQLGKVTEIEGYAFSGCTSLEEIGFAGTTDEWALVTLGDGWNNGSGIQTIHCTNGDIAL